MRGEYYTAISAIARSRSHEWDRHMYSRNRLSASTKCQLAQFIETVLSEASLRVAPIPREALFLAGKAFLTYRRRKGAKQGVLTDFYIGVMRSGWWRSEHARCAR